MCPAAAVLVLEIVDVDEWDLTVTWSPDVLVAVVGLNFQVNGGGFTNYDTATNVHSGQIWTINPADFGEPGNLLQFQVQCVGIVGCANFNSNIVGAIVGP